MKLENPHTKRAKIFIMKIFKRNFEKNEILALNRGITFEEIVQKIQWGAKVIETVYSYKKVLKIALPSIKQ